jgi:hypothetical protein
LDIIEADDESLAMDESILALFDYEWIVSSC